MKMNALQLKGIAFTKITLEYRVEQLDYSIPALVDANAKFAFSKESANLFRVMVTVTLKDQPEGKKTHIVGEITVQGHFEISKDISEDLRDSLISITAPSILYSSAREMIAIITGRYPGGSVQIGTLSFPKRTFNNNLNKPS